MKIRMYFDYYKYLFFIKKSETSILIIDLLLFIFSTKAFFMQWGLTEKNILHSASIFIVAVLSLIKFIYDTYKMITDLKKYNDKGSFSINSVESILYKNNLYFLNDIYPSTVEEGYGFTRIDITSQDDFVFYSEKVNDLLWEKVFQTEINNNKEKKIKRMLSAEKEELLPFFNHHFNNSIRDNKYFFNQKKLCLSNDVYADESKIYCHKGSYYDTFLTNHVCTKALYKKNNDLIFKNGSNYFPFEVYENKFRIKEIKHSTINNEIGVSTLGFTSDNYLIIWKQNEHAQSSSNLFVPTGSGSSDWNDYDEASFNQSIINGMERELLEESGLINSSSGELCETKILGFFRWVKRGGKPEFVGITKIKAKSSDLIPLEVEVRESRTQHRWQIKSIDDLIQLIFKLKENPEYKNSMSVPLYMCLTSLESRIRKNREEVESFLGIKSSGLKDR
ncbi:hypothetical protein [Bacillus sp. 165]|uniref:hypothetical protein n=1 Tax=Bacillus sp. 165 TaxID=1529117 RepID=UPI001ADA7904|nr:hypothetical protein [Bacillus sp. 165]MBO9128390.1 hypothetical protein [Bacillus sp. 165]